MNSDDNNDKPRSDADGEEQLGFDQEGFHENPRRLEPVFDDFEVDDAEEDAYDEAAEEAEYDTQGYSTGYEEDTIDYDVDPESLEDDDDEQYDTADSSPPAPAWHAEELKPELQREITPEPTVQQDDAEPELDEPEADWQEESYYEEEEPEDGPWPMGLIIVAAFALLLLGAGGYGVMQQRAEMQEEIRALQAELANSASPEEILDSRETQRILDARNTELQSTVEALQLELRSLMDVNYGLQTQLKEAQKSAQQKPPPAPKAATKPKAEPAPVKNTAPAASAADSGAWFVNFSSYSKRETADTWANKLDPGAGNVTVTTGTRNGSTFYRVRVAGLASKAQAEGIARKLEQQYGLSKLWVGEQ